MSTTVLERFSDMSHLLTSGKIFHSFLHCNSVWVVVLCLDPGVHDLRMHGSLPLSFQKATLF